MAKFTISGANYQSRPLDGKTQIHVTRVLVSVLNRMAATITTLIAVFPQGRQIEVSDIEGAAEALQPIVEEIAKLKDADVDFIMDACLRVVQRQVDPPGNGWVPIVQNGVIQHQSDSAFNVRMAIIWYVLQESFGQVAGFLGLLNGQTGAGADA